MLWISNLQGNYKTIHLLPPFPNPWFLKSLKLTGRDNVGDLSPFNDPCQIVCGFDKECVYQYLKKVTWDTNILVTFMDFWCCRKEMLRVLLKPWRNMNPRLPRWSGRVEEESRELRLLTWYPEISVKFQVRSIPYLYRKRHINGWNRMIVCLRSVFVDAHHRLL